MLKRASCMEQAAFSAEGWLAILQACTRREAEGKSASQSSFRVLLLYSSHSAGFQHYIRLLSFLIVMAQDRGLWTKQKIQYLNVKRHIPCLWKAANGYSEQERNSQGLCTLHEPSMSASICNVFILYQSNRDSNVYVPPDNRRTPEAGVIQALYCRSESNCLRLPAAVAASSSGPTYLHNLPQASSAIYCMQQQRDLPAIDQKTCRCHTGVRKEQVM